MNFKDIFASLKERLKSNKDNYIEENSWCGDTESGFYTETKFDMEALYAEIDEFRKELAERALLAGAPAPIQQDPTLIAYVATDLDGRYDVGTTPEKAKERAGHGCDTVFPIYDIGPHATPPALAGSQVQDGD